MANAPPYNGGKGKTKSPRPQSCALRDEGFQTDFEKHPRYHSRCCPAGSPLYGRQNCEPRPDNGGGPPRPTLAQNAVQPGCSGASIPAPRCRLAPNPAALCKRCAAGFFPFDASLFTTLLFYLVKARLSSGNFSGRGRGAGRAASRGGTEPYCPMAASAPASHSSLTTGQAAS